MIMYLCLLAGLVIGYGVAYMAYSNSPARKALEEALAQKQRELTDYQNQVIAHFQKTSELVEALHAHHNNILDHLCEGAKSLRPQTVVESIIDPAAPTGGAAPKDYWITNDPTNVAVARDS
ncbi:MAG: YhcB family protein [Gammaproteobacteria bacterium]